MFPDDPTANLIHETDAVGLVRTPQIATNGREQQLASYRCHRLQLGHRLLRILLSGTSQPHRFRG